MMTLFNVSIGLSSTYAMIGLIYNILQQQNGVTLGKGAVNKDHSLSLRQNSSDFIDEIF